MEQRKVGTIREKIPKQGLTRAKDLTLMIPGGPWGVASHTID